MWQSLRRIGGTATPLTEPPADLGTVNGRLLLPFGVSGHLEELSQSMTHRYELRESPD
jgi:hypothetical protein